MGKNFGGASGGGRQGDEERVELPEQGDEQLVQEVLPLRRRCGADVKRWESSFTVAELMLRFCRRRRRIGDDACDGVKRRRRRSYGRRVTATAGGQSRYLRVSAATTSWG